MGYIYIMDIMIYNGNNIYIYIIIGIYNGIYNDIYVYIMVYIGT